VPVRVPLAWVGDRDLPSPATAGGQTARLGSDLTYAGQAKIGPTCGYSLIRSARSFVSFGAAELPGLTA
jgi:hypothetical protein